MNRHQREVMFKDTPLNRQKGVALKVGHIHLPNCWLGTMVKLVGRSQPSLVTPGKVVPVYAYYLPEVDIKEHLSYLLLENEKGGETND